MEAVRNHREDQDCRGDPRSMSGSGHLFLIGGGITVLAVKLRRLRGGPSVPPVCGAASAFPMKTQTQLGFLGSIMGGNKKKEATKIISEQCENQRRDSGQSSLLEKEVERRCHVP